MPVHTELTDVCKRITKSTLRSTVFQGGNMQRKLNSNLTCIAKVLRKNMTRQERHLWYDYLRGYPVKFYRQRVLGKYVVDFYCAKVKLVIELDGSQHYSLKEQAKDNERSEFLEMYGITVLRFSNYDVDTNFDGVCLYINSAVESLLEEQQASIQ